MCWARARLSSGFILPPLGVGHGLRRERRRPEPQEDGDGDTDQVGTARMPGHVHAGRIASRQEGTRVTCCRPVPFAELSLHDFEE